MVKVWARLALCITCVAGILFFGWPAYLKYSLRRNAEAHVVGYTRQDLRNVSSGLLMLYEIEKVELPRGHGAEFEISGADLYKMISESKSALEASRPSETSASRGVFCDRWGNEIHGRVT